MMKKIGLIILGLIVLVFLGRQVLGPRLAPKMFQKIVKENIGVDKTKALADGLHIYVCGAGSPLPDLKRSGPCLGVIAGDRAFIFDAGTGGARNLGPMGFPVARTEHVYLTHTHSDHFDGLGELMLLSWVNSARTEPLPISGPAGTADVVNGFNAAYKRDSEFRTAHHGPSIANPASFGGAGRDIEMTGASEVVYDQGGVVITAFLVDHAPISPAFGYRVDYKGRAAVFSGDTAYDPRIAVAAKGVDVLFHEALNKDMVETMQKAAKDNGAAGIATIMGDILDYHATPIEAAKTAQAAGARDLVLYHIVPPLPRDALIPMFVKGADAEFDGPITVSADGMIVRLPAGGKTIDYESVF